MTPPGSTAAAPPSGFLTFGADGPFKGFYHSIAGDAWADWLFMPGLLGIGARPHLRDRHADRRRRRRALYLMMWSVALLPATTRSSTSTSSARSAWSSSALTYAGDTWGLGRRWARTDTAGRSS